MMRFYQPTFAIAGPALLGCLVLGLPLETDGVKVDDYAIDAEFFPEQGRMNATVDISFVPGTVTDDTLVFFLHGELRVDFIEFDGQRVEPIQERVHHTDDYSSMANRVKVGIEEVVSTEGMRVGYSGYMNPSVVGAISNYMRIDSDGVFLRSLGYSIWFPVFVTTWRDSYEVSFSKVTIRTPPEFRAVFAGEQVREYAEGGSNVSEWSAPKLDLFNAQCTARRFDVMADRGFRLYHLRDSTAQQKAADILSFSQQLETLYQSHYRHGVSTSQMHVMQMPRYGDIASGNVIGISDGVWNEFEVTAWQSTTVAHELVHTFVQLPRSEEMGAFVIEGFPSYFHLPAMAEILGEQWYRDYMGAVEAAYLSKRETGLSRRGKELPPEKPILEIRTDEISRYKDTFVLNDRVRLFFDYLRRRLGNDGFFQLTSDLLNHDVLDYATLLADIETYLPGSGNDIVRWLKTTEFPDDFRADAP